MLRRKRRWGADHIAFEVGLAASTVQHILRAAGCARLDRGDRATDRSPVQRYQRERPGELIHVDVKKLAAIPDGGGWWMHGRGNDGHGGHMRAGYRYLHSALDDRTRVVYSEILNDEQAQPQPRSGAEPQHGSPRSVCIANESLPTTALVTAPGCGTAPAPAPTPS
jgi:hypothetical protein